MAIGNRTVFLTASLIAFAITRVMAIPPDYNLYLEQQSRQRSFYSRLDPDNPLNRNLLLYALPQSPEAKDREEILSTLLQASPIPTSSRALLRIGGGIESWEQYRADYRDFTQRATPVLTEALSRPDSSPMERYRLLNLLDGLAYWDESHSMRNDNLISALKSFQADADPRFGRQETGSVASILGRIGGSDAVAYLRLMANSGDLFVSRMGVLGLGQLRDPREAAEAVEFLMQRRGQEMQRNSPNTELIEAIDRAIGRLRTQVLQNQTVQWESAIH